jgi:hypothetical protein
MNAPTPINAENFEHTVLVFRDRQAGVSFVYDPFDNSYTYNAYVVETKLVKEIHAQEFDFLEDAINYINDEFGNWEVRDFDTKGCGSCSAK